MVNFLNRTEITVCTPVVTASWKIEIENRLKNDSLYLMIAVNGPDNL